MAGDVTIQNIIAFGSFSVSLDGGPATIQPRLPFRDIAGIVEDGEINTLSALVWEYQLSERLFGRDDDLAKILSWANNGDNTVSIRLVTGPGGAGKTRLVAEAARRLRTEGWVAGFLPERSVGAQVIDASSRAGGGLFLAIDYPEERPELVEDLLARVADIVNPPLPIRLLLVSRRDHATWRAQASRIGHLFGRQEIAAPGPLSEADGLALARDVAARLASLAARPVPSLSAAETWLRRNSLNRLPLMTMAATIHAVLVPEAGFVVAATRLMEEIAERERDRTRRQGFAGLDRLLALSLLHPSGLDAKKIIALGELEVTGALRGQILLDRLRATPWWKGGADGARLARLEPDLPASVFLKTVLLDDPDPTLPDRIHVATSGSGSAFEAVLSRLSFDLLQLYPAAIPVQALETALLKMLDEAPERAVDLRDMGFTEGTAFSAGFAAHVLELLLPFIDSDEVRAIILNNLSAFLSRLGRHEAALAAAEVAVAYYRTQAAALPESFTPSLASALNNFANHLSALGRREAALAAAEKTTALYRTLVSTRPDAFTPDLAKSLNNLAARLSDLGRREAALAAAEEAVALRTTLAAVQPEAFTADLASSLNNLANYLSDLGLREAALAKIEEAVELRQALAAARPEAFTPDLAASYGNLANRLFNLGRHEAALVPAEAAVTLFRTLAAARPDAFSPDLGKSLVTLATLLSALGHHEAALSPAEAAVALFRTLAEARPDAFTPNLAASISSLAGCLSALGRFEPALAAAEEAVALRRPLAAAHPEALIPDLARSLNNLAGHLSALGQREAALAAAQEAVTLRRPLAAAQPEAFVPDLAMSLGAMGEALEQLGRVVAARDCAREGVAGLLPFFLALPQAYAGLMGGLARDYLKRCKAVGEAPDRALLAPIVEMFDQMNKRAQ